MKHKQQAFVARLTEALWTCLRTVGIAVALAIPFMRYRLGWLIVFALLPLFGLLEWMEQQDWTIGRKVRQIWAVGIVFFGIIVSWLYHIHATDLIENSLLRLVFIFITFLLVAGWLSIGFGLFGWVYYRFKLSLKRASSLATLPVLWAIGEFVRSVAFSVFSIGPGGSIGSHWNFGALGLAASSSPAAYGARLLGMYGLSALILAVALALYNLLRRRNLYASVATLVVATLVVLAGYGLYAQPSKPQQVKVGLTYLKGEDDVGYERNLLSSVRQHASGRADVLILPEYSHFYEDGSDIALDRSITSAVLGDNAGARIITSRLGSEAEGHSNNVIFLRPDGSTQIKQPKQFLIPAGEFVPYVYQVILTLSGNTSVISNHEATKSLTASQQTSQPVTVRGVRVGALACSGAIAPEFYRNLARQGAEVLVNTASLSSMGIDKLYFEQSRQMARFQAVANARPFVQSARGGESYIVDLNGNFVLESHGDTNQYLEGVTQTSAKRTIYSLYGEWLLVLGGIGLIAGYCLDRHLTKRQKDSTMKRKNNREKVNQNKT